MNTKRKTLYAQVVAISEEYLGPAGERFIKRQIKMHLNIEPAKLSVKHLDDLAHWTSLTFAVLTKSREEVEEFTYKLKQLTKQKT